MCISSAVSTGHWFLGAILALQHFLPPLLHPSLRLEGKDLMKTFFNEEPSVVKSLIFYTLSNYESLCTAENSLLREWWTCLPDSEKIKKLPPPTDISQAIQNKTEVLGMLVPICGSRSV